MNIYLIEILDQSKLRSWWDCHLGHVIRATSPAKVRKIAAAVSMDEGSDLWLDKKKVGVKALAYKVASQKEEIILSDCDAR